MTDAAHAPSSEQGPPPGEVDRIFTVPTMVTLVRLLMLPVFLWFLFAQDNRHVAGWVLVLTGATDWVDGYLARRLNQVSEFGKIIDPVADRVLFFVGVGAILIEGAVPVWLAVAVLVREVLISIATVGLAALGATRIDVTWIGKTATFLLMGVFPGFLLSKSDATLAPFYGFLSWSCAIPGLVLSYYSLLLYIPKGRAALAEGRAGRAEAGT